MFMRNFLSGCVLPMMVVCLAVAGASAQILEFKFNEDDYAYDPSGMSVRSSGSSNDVANTFYGFRGVVAGITAVDLHTASGLGVGGDLVGNPGYGTDRALQAYYDGVTDEFGAPINVEVIALNETSTAVSGLAQWTVSGWYKLSDNEDAGFQGGSPFFQTPGSSEVFTSINPDDPPQDQIGNGFAVRAHGTGNLRIAVNSATDWEDGVTFTNQKAGDAGGFDPKGIWVYFAVAYDGNSTTDNVNIYQGFRNEAEAAAAGLQVGKSFTAGVTLMDTLTIDAGPTNDSEGFSMLGRIMTDELDNYPGIENPIEEGAIYHWMDALYDNMRVDSGTLSQSDLENYRATDAIGTPVPEPSSLVLLLGALGCGVAFRRTGRRVRHG